MGGFIYSNKLHRHTVVRKLRIDAGHRLVDHEGKCSSFHGHSYTFEIYACSDELDNVGRVTDFGVIKEIIGTWIDANLDHAMILNTKDPFVYLWSSTGPLVDMKVFYLPYNPSAENLASFMLEVSNDLLISAGHGHVKVVKVVCQETPNCSATAEL